MNSPTKSPRRIGELVEGPCSMAAKTGRGGTRSLRWIPLLCSAFIAVFSLSSAAFAQPAVPSPVQAQVTGPTTSSEKRQTRVTDETFVADAARFSLYQIAGSRLATRHGNNEQVRSFAQTLIEDHARVHAQWVELARATNIELPSGLAPAQETAVERLAALTGPSFDRLYMQTIGIDANEQSLKRFRDAATAASAPAVRDFARRTWPILEAHLTRARALILATQKIAMP